MSKACRNLAAVALLASWLGGCVGAAGVSTWQYQSGPGYETERVSGSSIQADTAQGLRHEVCTSVTRRQAGVLGSTSIRESTSCDDD